MKRVLIFQFLCRSDGLVMTLVLFALAYLLPLSVKAEEHFNHFLFIDTYSAYSSNISSDRKRAYLTQAKRDEGYHLNLGAFGGAYDDKSLRAKLIAQLGDSVDANYESEPIGELKYIQEGYVGVYIDDDSYLDVGTFLSHLGAEGWLSKDNFNYTRSLIAEFSPYYETGVRFSRKLNQTWSFQLLGLNGWQNTTDNRHPALGTQIAYAEEDLSFSYNSFLGEEDYGVRSFHDLVLTTRYGNGLSLIGSFDFGTQSEGSIAEGHWYGYALMAKQSLNETFALNGRLESYFDREGIIVQSVTGNDFVAHSLSIGLDVSLAKGVTLRGEVRRFISGNEIFIDRGVPARGDTLFVISLSFWEEGAN